MKNKQTCFVYLVLCVCLMCGCARLRRLQPLADKGENDLLKEEALLQETESFRKIEQYLQYQGEPINISSDIARRQFGEPVVVVQQNEKEKWVYNPAEDTWFGGEKMDLLFDVEGTLVDWEHINQPLD